MGGGCWSFAKDDVCLGVQTMLAHGLVRLFENYALGRFKKLYDERRILIPPACLLEIAYLIPAYDECRMA